MRGAGRRVCIGEPVISASPALLELIRPVGLASFLTYTWGRRPRHFAAPLSVAPRQWLADLSLADMIVLALEQTPADVPAVELLSPTRYVPAPSRSAATSALGNGLSLRLNRIDGYFPAVWKIKNAIRQSMLLPVTANAYVSPPHAQALPAHVDLHDVLVVQIAGQKVWHVAQSAGPAPAARLPRLSFENRRPVVRGHSTPAPYRTRQIMLSEGDRLYVPRGCWHEAVARDVDSVHITFGIHAVTLADLIAQCLLLLAEEDEGVGAALPPQYTKGRRIDPREMARICRYITNRKTVREALERISEKIASD